MAGYWIKSADSPYWREVTVEEYVRVERGQGFHNTMGHPERPATSAFTGADGTRGTQLEPMVVAVPGFDPEHHYYSPLGEPVSLMRWAELRKEPKLVQTDFPTFALLTVYLGFVDPHVYDARLFGTARITKGDGPIQQLDVHNSEAAAFLRHQEHVAAIQAGHHCALCRDGRRHTG